MIAEHVSNYSPRFRIPIQNDGRCSPRSQPGAAAGRHCCFARRASVRQTRSRSRERVASSLPADPGSLACDCTVKVVLRRPIRLSDVRRDAALSVWPAALVGFHGASFPIETDESRALVELVVRSIVRGCEQYLEGDRRTAVAERNASNAGTEQGWTVRTNEMWSNSCGGAVVRAGDGTSEVPFRVGAIDASALLEQRVARYLEARAVPS